MAEIKKFGRKREPIPFEIDEGQVFYARPKLAAGVLMELMNTKDRLSETGGDHLKKLAVMVGIFEDILMPESFERFRDGVYGKIEAAGGNDSRTDFDPIDFGDLTEVIQWLIGEVYGERPTLPSLSLPGQSAEVAIGPSSTAGAHPAESSPSNSPGTGS